MSTPFISFLTEARMFYNASDLKSRTVTDIAELAYIMMLLLQVFRHQDEGEAKSYAEQSMRFNPYEKMHYAATDLGNLLAVLANQKNFDGKLKELNPKINLPLFQINRYLRDVKNGADSKNDDELFFYRCEEYLNLQSNAFLRQLRRDVLNWANQSFSERMRLDQLLRRELEKRGATVDLFLTYKQKAGRHGFLHESSNDTHIQEREYQVDIDKVATFHKSLNQKIWDGDELKTEVKKGLQAIAKKFLDFIDVDKLKVVDIILTGSNCAFNYTDGSDVDLHVVLDTSELSDDELVEPFLSAKKRLWNSGHNITVKGLPVELYPEIENQEDKLVATGIYSILSDRWIKRPTYTKIQIDDEAVQAKAIDLMQQIDEIIDGGDTDPDRIDVIWDKIIKMRRDGLDTVGEFSVENLAFKVLRNHGYLDKIITWKTEISDRDLSVESVGPI